MGGGVWVCRDGVRVWRWGVVCGCVGMCGSGGDMWVCRDGVTVWRWRRNVGV